MKIIWSSGLEQEVTSVSQRLSDEIAIHADVSTKAGRIELTKNNRICASIQCRGESDELHELEGCIPDVSLQSSKNVRV